MQKLLKCTDPSSGPTRSDDDDIDDDTVPSELVDTEERVQQAQHRLHTGSSSAMTITSAY